MLKEAKKEIIQKANKVWETYFGSATEGNDCFGTKIKKTDFKLKKSIFGWDIDYICPKSLFGSNCIENLQPLSINNLKQKKDYLKGNIKIDCDNKNIVRNYNICSNPFIFFTEDKKKIGITEIEINPIIDHFFIDKNKHFNKKTVYVYNGYFWIIENNNFLNSNLEQNINENDKKIQTKFWYYAPIDFDAKNGSLKQLSCWKIWK